MHHSASSCLLMSLNYRFLPYLKCSKNSRKNIKKISVQEASRCPKRGQRGARGTQAATWRGPPPGRARRAPGPPSPPLVPPFGLYYLLAPETLERNPASRFPPLFRRRSASKIGSVRRPLPGTLPEGGITSGSSSTIMDASRMCRE